MPDQNLATVDRPMTPVNERRAAPRAALARWAVTVLFAANGLTIAALAVRTPSLKIEHGLTAGQLGVVSALFGVAAVLSMQLTGGLAARLGSASILRSATLVLPFALLGVGLADGLAALAAAMLFFGAVHGLVDVTMNAHAVAIERELGRPIMNGCHAAWSIGAVTGSVAGGAAAQAGLSLASHYLVVGVGLVVLALLAAPRLLPAFADRQPRPTAAADRPGWRTGWTPRLLVLGTMGATVLTVEAAVANWSGVYLHDDLGASLGVASLGYIAFIACETAGRLAGDRLFTRFPARTLVGTGTLVAAGGLTVVVLSPWASLTIAGFTIMGFGLATPLPVLFSVIGHLGADGPGAAGLLARFTTMTYSGILLGPALIGWLAQGIGLTWTLTALIPLLALQSRLASNLQD
ncbi:MFS transporter [Actinomadura welshii]|uniref:MFS transporter n=1 Tax=Actinomadura welshii TaxID=3103817 RepID=UPI000404D2D6|nr:MFS transporter [Actinomadura madurae]